MREYAKYNICPIIKTSLFNHIQILFGQKLDNHIPSLIRRKSSEGQENRQCGGWIGYGDGLMYDLKLRLTIGARRRPCQHPLAPFEYH